MFLGGTFFVVVVLVLVLLLVLGFWSWLRVGWSLEQRRFGRSSLRPLCILIHIARRPRVASHKPITRSLCHFLMGLTHDFVRVAFADSGACNGLQLAGRGWPDQNADVLCSRRSRRKSRQRCSWHNTTGIMQRKTTTGKYWQHIEISHTTQLSA